MRGLTYSTGGALAGLFLAALIGAGSLIQHQGLAAFTSSGVHAMGVRTLYLIPQFAITGMILALVLSSIKPRDAAENGILVQPRVLFWHIAVPLVGFVIIFILSKENIKAVAFFTCLMIGSISSLVARSYQNHALMTAPERTSEPDPETGATVVWHPGWSPPTPN